MGRSRLARVRADHPDRGAGQLHLLRRPHGRHPLRPRPHIQPTGHTCRMSGWTWLSTGRSTSGSPRPSQARRALLSSPTGPAGRGGRLRSHVRAPSGVVSGRVLGCRSSSAGRHRGGRECAGMTARRHTPRQSPTSRSRRPLVRVLLRRASNTHLEPAGIACLPNPDGVQSHALHPTRLPVHQRAKSAR